MTPLAGVGLICVLFSRKYTLKRNFVKAGDQASGDSTKYQADTDDVKDVNEGKDRGTSRNVSPEPAKTWEPQAAQDEKKV